jgi:ergothioneine biosynthesis protein EgtB
MEAPSTPVVEAPAEALARRYRAVRRATEGWLEGLTPEDCVLQSMPDASPVRWHLAHTTWFFETFVLARVDARYVPFHPAYAYLFNSYYNAVGAQYPRPRRGLLSRPSLAEILDYRREVDRRMDALLARGVAVALAPVVELGLQHEQQHQELILTDVKHLLSLNPLHPTYRAPRPALHGEAARVEAPPLRWFPVEGGLHAIGHEGPGFAYDNEGPRHRVHLEPFRIASRLATNGEFLAFVREGGYERPEPWLSDGWAAVRVEGWRAPLHWVERDGEWREFTLGGLVPLDLAAPVAHVSYYEADAFAHWAGARLPTEAEWEVAAAAEPVEGNFADDAWLRPMPAEDRGDRPALMFGDAWVWTSSAYSPYPGYRAPDGALGEYNGKFMVGQQVLRGGSCATPRGHVRATYRNFFPPAARWQFSGIRLAR